MQLLITWLISLERKRSALARRAKGLRMDGVRAAAKSVVKKIPRSKRDGIYKVIDSKSPLLMVELIAANLD